MNLVLDTCIVRRYEKGMSNVPNFNYSYVEQLINDKNNKLFVTEFTCFELFMQEGFSTFDELNNFLKSNNLNVLVYDCPYIDPDIDFVNKTGMKMTKEITRFLEFFVLNLIVLNLENKNINEILHVVYNETEMFYKDYGELNSKNCTRFMKNDAINYIIEASIKAFEKFGVFYNKDEILALISTYA